MPKSHQPYQLVVFFFGSNDASAMRREHVAVKTPIGALNLTHSSHVYRHAFTELFILCCKSTNKKYFQLKTMHAARHASLVEQSERMLDDQKS